MNILYRNFNSTRRFGVEVEVSNSIDRKQIVDAIKDVSYHKVISLGHVDSVNNKSWHIKTDETCGESADKPGYEIASFVGKYHKDILHFGEAITAVKDKGAELTPFCGLHVHVEVDDYSIEQLGVLLALWAKVERAIKYAVSKNRIYIWSYPVEYILQKNISDNYYWRTYTPKELVDYFLKTDRRKNFYSIRYRAVNVYNYFYNRGGKRKTIEFRIPESSLEEDDVVNWTRLFVNFVNYAKNQPMPKMLSTTLGDVEWTMQLMGLHHDENFYIFSPGLNQLRAWFLERLLKNGLKNKPKTKWQKFMKLDTKKLLRSIKCV